MTKERFDYLNNLDDAEFDKLPKEEQDEFWKMCEEIEEEEDEKFNQGLIKCFNEAVFLNGLMSNLDSHGREVHARLLELCKDDLTLEALFCLCEKFYSLHDTFEKIIEGTEKPCYVWDQEIREMQKQEPSPCQN